MNYGYVTLDCGGLDLSSSSEQSITGSWKRANAAIATNKPIFAYNAKYGTGKPVTPVPCLAWKISATEVVIVGATLHVHVTSADKCTVLDVAPPNLSKKTAK